MIFKWIKITFNVIHHDKINWPLDDMAQLEL